MAKFEQILWERFGNILKQSLAEFEQILWQRFGNILKESVKGDKSSE